MPLEFLCNPNEMTGRPHGATAHPDDGPRGRPRLQHCRLWRQINGNSGSGSEQQRRRRGLRQGRRDPPRHRRPPPAGRAADRPKLEAAFKAAGVDYDIQNAQSDAQKMQTIAQQMITGGVTVLAIVNLDSASGAAIEQQAKKQGVSDHRLRPAHAGRLGGLLRLLRQHQGRQAAGRGPAEVPRATRRRTSPTSTARRTTTTPPCSPQGAHAVLDKVTHLQEGRRAGRARSGTPVQAATIFEQMYTQAGGNIQGVYAANDTLANAAIQTLKRNNQTDPGHRSGRRRRGSAEHPLRRPVHDGLEAGRRRGQGAVRRRRSRCSRATRRRRPARSRTPRATATSRRSCSTRSRSPRTTLADVDQQGRAVGRATSAPASTPPCAPRRASSSSTEPSGRPIIMGRPDACPYPSPTDGRRDVSAPTVRPDDDTPTLELRGVNKSFGAIQVLHDVHLKAYRGQVTALVGDNGAGKSTLIKAIAGIHPVDSGEFLFEGKPVTRQRAARRRRARHRGRLPGPRAGRQPRRRPEHVPRPGAQATACCSTRCRWSSRPARPWPGCRSAP